MASGKVGRQGIALRYMFYGRGLQRSVGLRTQSLFLLHLKRIRRLVGFEELGNNDSFATGVLELRLSQSGMQSIVFQSNNAHRRIGVLKKQQGTVMDPVYQVASYRKTDDSEEVFDL